MRRKVVMCCGALLPYAHHHRGGRSILSTGFDKRRWSFSHAAFTVFELSSTTCYDDRGAVAKFSKSRIYRGKFYRYAFMYANVLKSRSPTKSQKTELNFNRTLTCETTIQKLGNSHTSPQPDFLRTSFIDQSNMSAHRQRGQKCTMAT